MPSRRRVPVRGARHQPVGRGHVPALPAQSRSRSGSPGSSRSTSLAAPPTAVKRCSTMSASIAASRTLDDGTVEVGFRVYVAGGLGANPHPALALEPFTSREDLLPTIESILRVFEQNGNRKNKLRARMKWLVDTLGFEELQERIFAIRKFLLASSTWPGGIPDEVEKLGDAPAGLAVGVTPTAIGQGTPVALRGTRPYERWEQANVVRGAAKGTVSANVYSRLGDVTSAQFRSLAVDPARPRTRGAHHQSPELRVPRTHRGPVARRSTRGSSRSAWPNPAPSWRATSSPARAPTRATWPSPRSRGLADAIGVRARGRGPGRGRRRTHQHLGLHELLRPAPRVRHRVLRCRAPRARPTRTGLPDAARRLRRRGADPLRREGTPFAGKERTERRRQRRSVGSPPNARPAKRSDRGWIEPAVPKRSPPTSKTSTTSRRPTRLRTTTSTSTKPDPTWPRSANRSAPHERDQRKRQQQRWFRRTGIHRRGARRAQRRVRTAAGVEDHPMGGRQLRAASVARRVDDRRRSDRSRGQGRPEHRGRVHRHRLSLPADARDRRTGASSLRAQPQDDDGAGARRRVVEGRRRRTAAQR